MRALIFTAISLIVAMVYVALASWAFITIYGWLVFVLMMLGSSLSLVYWCNLFSMRKKTDIERLLEKENRDA